MRVSRASSVSWTVGSGLGFTEGPLWTLDHRLLVCSISRGRVYEIDLERAAPPVVFAETGGNPSGISQDAGGDVWVAQGGGHTRTRSERPVAPGIQRLTAGLVDDVVTSGRHAPNDIVVGPDQRLWFTDPRGEALSEDGPPGEVCVLDPVTGELTVANDELRFPNGLAFSRDGRTLYVAETGRARVRRFVVDGMLLTEDGPPLDLPRGRPDGLAVDREDRVHAAAFGADAVVVFASDGRVDEVVELEPGSTPTNLCFGGPGRSTLFVTAVRGGRVLAVPREVPG